MGEERLALAVVGLGRAGRARVAALEAHPRARLAALVRRQPEPGERGFAEVLGDPEIQGVILCTPNLGHAPAAESALAAGKHVLVEFPLAASAGEARALQELATRVQSMLHVEHIELLSPSQRHQRERVAGLGRPLGGELSFTASNTGWIGDPAQAGSPALRAVARLHRLVDLFGEARVEDARLEGDARAYRLVVELGFAAGAGPVRLVETRKPELERATRWAIDCENGRLGDPPVEAPGALFRQDLDVFVARVLDGKPGYVPEARVLHVLELVERIEELCTRGSR